MNNLIEQSVKTKESKLNQWLENFNEIILEGAQEELHDFAPQCDGHDLDARHLHWPSRDPSTTSISHTRSLATCLPRWPHQILFTCQLRRGLQHGLPFLSSWCSNVSCQVDSLKIYILIVSYDYLFIRFESFGYTTQELLFDWLRDGSQVNKNISLAQFDVETSLVALSCVD